MPHSTVSRISYLCRALRFSAIIVSWGASDALLAAFLGAAEVGAGVFLFTGYRFELGPIKASGAGLHSLQWKTASFGMPTVLFQF